MKNLITLINLSIIFGITAIFTTPKKSNDIQNNAANVAMSGSGPSATSPETSIEQKASLVKNSNRESVALAASDLDFITRSVEVCLIKLEEGKIAQQQGVIKAIKDHGSVMVADLAQMLTDLKEIALRKSVITSADMPDNFFALEDLRRLHGEPFDKKFVKKMLYNYKRDVRDLERATHSKDADIKVFATKYLPVLQSHLEQVKLLKKKL